MKEKDANRMYRREFWGAMGLYIVVLMVAVRVGRGMEPGTLKTVVMISPMIPFLLTLWVVVRHMGRLDEFLRRTQLENLAIAGAVTAAWTFTYGFLETAGYPRLSMFTVWPVFGAVWGGLTCIRNWLDR